MGNMIMSGATKGTSLNLHSHKALLAGRRLAVVMIKPGLFLHDYVSGFVNKLVNAGGKS
jgi:hypothetical protein